MDRHDDETTHDEVLAAAGYRDVRSRGGRVDAHGRAGGPFRDAVGTFWARLHGPVGRFRRVRPRNGRVRAGDRLRVHRAHEHAGVHTWNPDANRLPGDLSGERLLPGGELRDGPVRAVQLERRQQPR